MRALYTASTEGAVALAAATAKTVLAVVAPAQFGIELKGIRFGFDGVAAGAVPVLVELCRSTQAGAGTSTAATVDQIGGRTITPGFTAARNYTAEPTVLTALEEWLLSPYGGAAWIDIPLGDEYDTAVSEALALRINAPAVVNVRATMKFARC